MSLTMYQDYGKGGVVNEFKGVAFITVWRFLAVLESTLPSVCLFYKLQHNEATVAVLKVLAVSVVVVVSVMTATPQSFRPFGPKSEKSLEKGSPGGPKSENSRKA